MDEQHPEVANAAAEETPIARLLRIIDRMVNPGGCAWHQAQTHDSLTRFLIEETYELTEAIETQGSPDEVRGELGDVLYQVLFHAAIAQRDGEGYDFDAVCTALADKLVARHPHVFGDRGDMTVEDLHAEWEGLKEDAEGAPRGSRTPLEGVPSSLPTLARAAKVVERLKRSQLLNPEGEETTSEALGEALLALVEQANANGIDADAALRGAISRLITDRTERP